MSRIQIVGSGYASIDNPVSNEDLEKIVDTSDEWIYQRTGIKNRYISKEENTSDLACKAALMAMENSGMNKEQIGAIILATMTPDRMTPSTACIVQAKLGMNNQQIFAIDINAACSGFIYGFQLACDLLDRFEYILVIGAETLSKIIDWTDRNTCVLFGDGAGAMILTKGNQEVYHYANSEGDLEDILYVNELPLKGDLVNLPRQDLYLHMQGNAVFRFACNAIVKSIDAVLKDSHLTIEDIDLIIPHQANKRIIAYVAKKMKVDLDLFYMNMEEYGNTSSASIPIAYATSPKKSGNIILVGFGAGLTYGATLIRGK